MKAEKGVTLKFKTESEAEAYLDAKWANLMSKPFKHRNPMLSQEDTQEYLGSVVK